MKFYFLRYCGYKGKKRKHGRHTEMIEIRLQGKASNDGSNNTYKGNLKEMLEIKL